MIQITTLASGSKGNCYHLTDGTTQLLIEAGIPWKQIRQRLNFKTSEIAGVLVSHSHQDHCKGIKDAMDSSLSCYTSQGTIDALGLTGHCVEAIRAREQFTIGTWTILPFETEHDCEGSLGFLLANQSNEKLLFVTDSFYCRYRFKGLTHIMVECNYSLDILRANVAAGLIPADLKNRLMKSHFSLDNVKAFLKANDLSQVEEIHLIHLSEGNSDAARFKREVQALTGKPVIIAGL